VLNFLVTADHAYTLQDYFSHWGARLSPQVRLLHYEARPWTREPLPGAWIFTDIERLRGDEFQAACELAQRLSADPAKWRVLNDPRRVLLRYALLRDLANAGINDFRVFRLPELPDDVRYPIFLRGENDHQGAVTGLLQDAQQVRDATRDLPDKDKLLAVEYLSYRRADDVFVKYSMMRIGDAVVPRHALFSQKWVLKDPDMVDDRLMLEEDLFVRESPHRLAVMDIFQRAGIDYGRIDYTLANGRIQVFEINTNPIVLHGIPKLATRRWQSQASSAQQMNEAFSKVAIGLPEANPDRLEADRRAFRRRRGIHRVLRKLRLRPGARL
jgi:hypothetical protein